MTRHASLLLAGTLLVAIVLFRTVVSGWGPPEVPPESVATLFGMGAYPADNLSYVSWAQQARDGRWLFDILYTTTEHERLFFNPLFLLVGKTASIAGVSPLLVLNLLAALALPVVVLSVSGMCRTLGLSSTATFAATCLAIGGAGLSWVRKLVEWSGVTDLLLVGSVGPDLSFYDVNPVVAYFLAPYHAISLAILALLALWLVQLDGGSRATSAVAVLTLACLGFLVAAIRPHTAIMVLAAYGAATIATACWTQSRALLPRRIAILACLAVAILPPVLYSIWLAQQPVWSDYARMHPDQRHDWFIGFLGLWVLGGIGAGILGGQRLLKTPYAFLASWAFGAATLLLVLNGLIYPKLTYGFTIGLGALAGVAIDRYAHYLGSGIRLAVTAAAIALLAVASPLVMMSRFARTPGTTAYSEFFQVVETLREDAAAHPTPAVLTDCDTGVLLPGLAGARVFCGHWALTDNNRQKIVLLSRLGFLSEGQSIPSFPGLREEDIRARGSQLLDQVEHGAFQYILVRKRDRIYQALAGAERECILRDGERFEIIRMCPAVKGRLAHIITSQSHGGELPLQSKS